MQRRCCGWCPTRKAALARLDDRTPTLHELRGHEEEFKRRAPSRKSTREFGAENWTDRLAQARAYDDRDPAVLVVGGGQAGLSIAARLHQLGIDTLIVDRHERVGDNWRKRYHSLTLHNEVHVNHLPYLPFPPTFPVYIPKDKLANWFESYVDAMELNFWTGTELVAGSYDDKRKRMVASRCGEPMAASASCIRAI